jgi:hypothetical protein
MAPEEEDEAHSEGIVNIQSFSCADWLQNTRTMIHKKVKNRGVKMRGRKANLREHATTVGGKRWVISTPRLLTGNNR